MGRCCSEGSSRSPLSLLGGKRSLDLRGGDGDRVKVFQAVFIPVNKLRVPNCTFLACFRAPLRDWSTCFTTCPALCTPSLKSSVRSVISMPVSRIASSVGGNSRRRVSNSLSALRAARANSFRVGIATMSTIVKLAVTNKKDTTSQKRGLFTRVSYKRVSRVGD